MPSVFCVQLNTSPTLIFHKSFKCALIESLWDLSLRRVSNNYSLLQCDMSH